MSYKNSPRNSFFTKITKFPPTCYFSAINPILYNALSTKFRRAFRRTLQCGGVSGGGASLPTPSLTYLANTRLSTVSMMQAGDTFNMHRSVRGTAVVFTIQDLEFNI